MALAVLCSHWQSSSGHKFTAFIVDHEARPGSGEEAKRTYDRLHQLGLSTV